MARYYQDAHKFPLHYDQLFPKCQEAVQLCRFQIERIDPSFCRLEAVNRVSWLSWGERFTVQVSPDSTVTARSTSRIFTTVLDWGKNKQNVNRFFRYLAVLAEK